jgi:hypothetical protein
VKLG